jgi:hypothetical protein
VQLDTSSVHVSKLVQIEPAAGTAKTSINPPTNQHRNLSLDDVIFAPPPPPKDATNNNDAFACCVANLSADDEENNATALNDLFASIELGMNVRGLSVLDSVR